MHFSFLPFWLMKSRLWLGALCFKHCLTSHSVFTSDTIHCSSRSFSAPFFHYNFLDLYSFSCSVIKCFPALRSVMVRCKEKWDYISCFFKEVFKATKIHRREQSLLGGGGCTLILSSAADAYNTYSWCFLEMYPVTLKLITITRLLIPNILRWPTAHENTKKLCRIGYWSSKHFMIDMLLHARKIKIASKI